MNEVHRVGRFSAPSSVRGVICFFSANLSPVVDWCLPTRSPVHRVDQRSSRLGVEMLTSSRTSAAGMLELIEEQMKDRATKQVSCAVCELTEGCEGCFTCL
jgi:hypothetical protein